MKCKICNSNSIKIYKKIQGYNLLKCRNCKTIFLDVTNIKQPINELYDKNYFENYLYETQRNFKSIKMTANYYLTLIQKNFRQINSVLDVGAGFGFFVKAFRELDLMSDGVEISEYTSKVAKEKLGIDLFNGTLIDYFPTKKFDLICFYHSFEHIPNPIETLHKAKELLNDNGILWLSLPNVISLDRFFHDENWNGWSLPYHLFHYSPSTIKSLLRKNGFTKIKIQKSFFNPLKIFRKKENENSTSTMNFEYSSTKELIRKPATILFTGQNMNVFAQCKNIKI